MLEYYENTGSAVAKLKWSGPSFAGLNGNIIPQAYLFESNSSGGTDTTAPVISTLSPADNATGVAHAADLVATFSENIVRGTGNITIKNLSDGTQTVIPVTDTAQVAIAGATLIINPTALLPGSKNHAVRIDATAIDDTSGNSFAGIANDTTWNFTTTAPDTTKPTPNPMSFAVPPQTGGSTSITMTATTASDASGVEYRFNNLTLGTSSPWQNSPVLTATGLAPSTQLHLHRPGARQERGREHHHRLRTRQRQDPGQWTAGSDEPQFLCVWLVQSGCRDARSRRIRRAGYVPCQRLAELPSPVGTGFAGGSDHAHQQCGVNGNHETQ